LTGLSSATRYFYRVLLDGEPDQYLSGLPPFATATAPPADFSGSFSVGIGSCARYAEDAAQPIWHAVHRHAPDLFIWTGDNIYGDSLNPGALAEEYRRQRIYRDPNEAPDHERHAMICWAAVRDRARQSATSSGA
jgi:alkaline phosphatase D